MSLACVVTFSFVSVGQVIGWEGWVFCTSQGIVSIICCYCYWQ